MVYCLVLDENVEHEVYHRLQNYGHDVEHVDTVPSLGKGTGDKPIARYSLETDRIIVTYDAISRSNSATRTTPGCPISTTTHSR